MFMDDFLAARAQMAMSLGFHIIFSCVGMVMPFLMAFAHWKYLKTNNEIYKGLTKAWSKGCLLYTSPSPRDRTRSRMPSSA